ncbi:MAG: ABC transporter ATP-binding protein/permease [Alphaproteobacteria bacterium]|nr:ABC transporter ATP-binding protein/permease [Alphaproteobacteria bacterium]
MSDKNVQSSQFPKTLLGFYSKFAWRPFAKLLSVFVLFALLYDFSLRVLRPMYLQWFLQLFENYIPGSMSFIEFALPTILIIGILFIAAEIIGSLEGFILATISPKMQQKLSEDLFVYTTRQSLNFYVSNMSGRILSYISRISDGAFQVFKDVAWITIIILVSCISMILMARLNENTIWLFSGLFVFWVSWAVLWRKRIKVTSENRAEENSNLSGHLTDSITNIFIVKMFSMMLAEIRGLAMHRKKYVKADIKSSFTQILFSGSQYYMLGGGYAILLLICVFGYQDGKLSVSEIVFIISAYDWIIGSFMSIFDHRLPRLIQVYADANRAYKEFVKPIDVLDVPNAPDLHVSHGKIEIRSVSFKYNRKLILDNMTLTIKPGEKVGLVGTSGAGKTTLVNLLMRFYDPAKGEIFIDGQNICKVKQDSLRESIAFIPQEPTMFNRTLKENIGYGRADATDTEIKRAAKRASADGFIMESPKKYDSLVGDRGIKLSGGQRQRIAIARAFLKDAPILILDEATAALDSETEATIQKSFEELSHGRTTIAIAHRLSTLRNMDRIVVIDKGHIVENGTHTQLLRKKGIYARLWKMQSGGFIQE